jgi:Flp pilus assembly protein TadG
VIATDSSRRGRGSVLIEFVLVLPLLLLLLLAAIDWGWYFVLRENAVHATREGARVGSVAATQGEAAVAAGQTVRAYLTQALGARRAVDPVVSFVALASGPMAISVRLDGYPAGSLIGLDALTRVPSTIDTRADMRLEVQP